MNVCKIQTKTVVVSIIKEIPKVLCFTYCFVVDVAKMSNVKLFQKYAIFFFKLALVTQVDI